MSKAALSISSSSAGGGAAAAAQGGPRARRGLLLAAAGGVLAGCGFQPMYGPASGAAGLSVDMRRELAAVRLDYIGERTGVLITRALERRFIDAAGGEVVAPKYTLQVNIALGAEILGYRSDGAISRLRFTATSNWVLLRRDNPPEEIKRGVVRTIDAFNVPDFQFFTAEISSEAMQRRLLEEVVEQVFLNVAANLRGYLRPSQG